MQLKDFLLSIALFALGGNIFAQDKIYKTDGDVIDAKIRSVGTKTISYVRFDNQMGPEYTIVKTDVEKIVYQNGNEDEFDDARSLHRHHRRPTPIAKDDVQSAKIKYNPNVIALAPLQFSENGLGAGVSYERALDKDGVIAFYLPVIMTFNLNSRYTNNLGNTVNGNPDMMLYAMPGVKIYPTGSYGTVKYSVGPSLVIANGQKTSYNIDPVTGNTDQVTQQHTMVGVIIINSLNINPTPNIYLGLDFGLGFSYLNRIGGINQGSTGLVQGAFKVGYRF